MGWAICVPHLQAQVEDGQGDWRKENGGPPLLEVQRDGPVQLPAPAAACVRHLQKLRGPLACGLHGRKWCRHAGKGYLLRAQGGRRRRWQEKVSQEKVSQVALLSRHLVSHERCSTGC